MIFAAFVVGYYFEAIMKMITGSYRMAGFSNGCDGGFCLYGCSDPDSTDCKIWREDNGK
jgi:hypothetical protein